MSSMDLRRICMCRIVGWGKYGRKERLCFLRGRGEGVWLYKESLVVGMCCIKERWPFCERTVETLSVPVYFFPTMRDGAVYR